MQKWHEKYLDIPYEWGKSDCLRLIEKVLQNEKNYKLGDNLEDIKEDWVKDTPSRLIDSAVQKGSIIEDLKGLQEFDTVFFKMDGVVRHMGIMIDNYGRFLHQLIKRRSRVDDINKRHWREVFLAGVRITFD